MSFKSALAARFGAAAPHYHGEAKFQARIASRLAERVARLELGRGLRILEIGCGTGFLGEILIGRLDPSIWLATDLAPAMVAMARQRLGTDRFRYAACDGERPAVAGGWDLILASLSFQWFTEPSLSLPRLTDLLAPGGRLMFATLGPGSFAEWTALAPESALAQAVARYPSADDLHRWLGPGIVEAEWVREPVPSAAAFLGGLKRIGADLGTGATHPMTLGPLRSALREFDRASVRAIRYQIFYGCHCAGLSP